MRALDMPNTKTMRNPIFSSYNFNPGMNGEYNRYDDALDRLRTSY